jgi:hypothetical protein
VEQTGLNHVFVFFAGRGDLGGWVDSGFQTNGINSGQAWSVKSQEEL